VAIKFYNTTPEIQQVLSFFNILLAVVIPFSIILGSNLIIIITMRAASRERKKMESTRTDIRNDTSYITVMLLFVSVAYIVTSFPYRLLDPILEIPEVKATFDMTKLYWKLCIGIAVYTTVNIWFLNFGLNFYLYCIGGGSKYRNDTKEVIKGLAACCYRRKH
jgi:hypothetical protein